MDADIEWYEITQEQFTNMLSVWVQDIGNINQHKYSMDESHCVVFSKINDSEFGLKTEFNPEANATTYYATLTALALTE